MHLLHLEDSETDAELIARAVQRDCPDSRIDQVRSRTRFQEAVTRGGFDAILADFALENYDGLAAFDFARQHCPDVPFIFVSGAIGEEKAIEAVKRGAADYVMKDRPARLVPAIRQALVLAGEKRLRHEKEAEVAATARRSDLLVQIASELFVAGTDNGSLDLVWRRLAEGANADGYLYAAGEAPGALTIEAQSGLDPTLAGELIGPEMLAALCSEHAEPSGALATSDLPRSSQGWRDGLRARGVRVFSCHRLQAGGRMLGLLVLISSTRDQLTGSEVSFLRTATDLVAAHLERNRLLGEVRRALQSAELANRAKDDLLAALSHELRTPLNPVLLLATDAAANDRLAPEVRADFATIVQHVKLETKLIDDLLDFTRLARNEVSLQSEAVRLHPILEAAARVVAADMAQKSVALELRLDAAHDSVRGDAGRLQQVFWTLLANGLKSIRADGRISVRTRVPRDRTLAVTITDSGAGLTPAEVERALQPFVRGEQPAGSSADAGGLGLGLATASKIVELHGGRIHVSSPGRGRGSSFTVELPALATGPSEQRSRGGLDGERASADQTGRPALLLVEDHEATRRALSGLLNRRGYRVETAGTVHEAREKAAAGQFDLVLCDIGLPDGNGYELMTELHRTLGLAGIALTGFRVNPEDPQFQAAGFVAWLNKPVAMDALEGLLVDALRREHPA